MLVMAMVKAVWVLGPPNLPSRKLIVELMVVILCCKGVGNIHPCIIHTNTCTIFHKILVGRIIMLMMLMVEVILVPRQPTSTTTNFRYISVRKDKSLLIVVIITQKKTN